MIHQHNSYEYTQPDIEGERSILKMDMNTTQFVRNLLLEQPTGRRMAFPSGNQTVYVNPYTILYAQSRDNMSCFRPRKKVYARSQAQIPGPRWLCISQLY